MDTLQETVFYRTYARWNPTKNRRETYEEAVERYVSYMHGVIDKKISDKRSAEILHTRLWDAKEAMLSFQAMPSMRAFWTAGPALDAENACAFNCAYTLIQNTQDLAEFLYLLMCGTGVSNSTERQFIVELPKVPNSLHDVDTTIVFEDSKAGWAKGFKEYLDILFSGSIPKYDLSAIRPEGSVLKTFGGRASGPEPLKHLLDFTKKLFLRKQGCHFESSDVADLACVVASIVVVGGARRAATLSLTNPSDRRMAEYKSGDWWDAHPYRTMVNVSACYTQKPEIPLFLEDWLALIKSRSGERAIVNREALMRTMEKQGREVTDKAGVNPLIHLAA